jgi:hypothetical protein
MKKNKPKYRIRNWKEYNRSLKLRGSLTFWLSEELLKNWEEQEQTGERGRSPRYSAAAISAMAQIKFVFHQAGRQTCGLVESIFQLLKVSLPVPDHSTLSRRMALVEVRLPLKAANKARHLVVDSTGLKLYGEGEWKVRAHDASKRRTWRKLHLQIDEASNEVVVCAASENSVSDDEMFVEMLAATSEEIEQISGDGSYDRKKVYQAIEKRQIKRAARAATKRSEDLETR